MGTSKKAQSRAVDHLSDEDLEALAFHEISVKKLARLCKPLSCWVEVEQSITPEEIHACIERGDESLVSTPLWTAFLFKKTTITVEENRDRHIQKVAWFVKNGFNDPIEIDVGSSRLGIMVDHLVQDGNHRLAAAIIRGDKTIKAHVGGSIEDAQGMNLWRPNAYATELFRRQTVAWEAENSKVPSRRRPSL